MWFTSESGRRMASFKSKLRASRKYRLSRGGGGSVSGGGGGGGGGVGSVKSENQNVSEWEFVNFNPRRVNPPAPPNPPSQSPSPTLTATILERPPSWYSELPQPLRASMEQSDEELEQNIGIFFILI